MAAYGPVTVGFWPAVRVRIVLLIAVVMAIGGAMRHGLRRDRPDTTTITGPPPAVRPGP